MAVEWMDPPRSINPRQQEIEADVAELKAHPGEWALVVREASEAAARAYQRRGCRTRIALTEDRRHYNIYAMWEGEYGSPPCGPESV